MERWQEGEKPALLPRIVYEGDLALNVFCTYIYVHGRDRIAVLPSGPNKHSLWIVCRDTDTHCAQGPAESSQPLPALEGHCSTLPHQ